MKHSEYSKLSKEEQKNVPFGEVPICYKLIIFGVLAALIILIVVNVSKETDPKEKRAEQLSEQFDPMWGNHIGLTNYIKNSMNDPDSFEHVETKYWDMDSVLVVAETYSGKNALGGRVKGFVKARVNMQGNVIEIIDSY